MIRRSTRPRRSSPPRRKPVSRRPKASRKKLKAECDRLFSRFIRLRDGVCRLEGDAVRCAGVLQCAHLFSRRYFGTRWDTFNAWALCAAHHVYYTHRPLEWDELLRREVVEYEALRQMALHESMPDLEETRDNLRELVRKYEILNAAC